MHARVVLGVGKGVLFREQFRGVLIEGFHCIIIERSLIKCPVFSYTQ